MNMKRNFRKAAELGVGLTMIAALVLAGCSGTTNSNSSSSSAAATFNNLDITPMKGKFETGATVRVKRAKDGIEVAMGTVNASGVASLKVPSAEAGPFLIEAGIAGDKYYDESTGASASVDAGTTALRALIADATSASAVGVTALTELAVAQIEAGSGISGVTATDVDSANIAIGTQFGVADTLATPSVVDGTTKLAGGNAADDYALRLAGLAKLAASGVPSLKALRDLRDDMKDGTLDGRIGTTPITTMAMTVAASGVTVTEFNTALAKAISSAAKAYAASGVKAPTVTLSVKELKDLVAAAMEIGAQAKASASSSALPAGKLKAQIAATVKTEVGAMATAVAGGKKLADAKVTSLGNAKDAGAILAGAAAAAKDMVTALKTGWYGVYPYQSVGITYGSAYKTSATGTGSLLTIANTSWQWNTASGVWEDLSAQNIPAKQWSLTDTTAGWVANDRVFNFVDNGDGSMTASSSQTGNGFTFVAAKLVLDGKPLKACTTCNAASYTSATYPAGSIGYRMDSQATSKDEFTTSEMSSYTYTATNGSGAALSALPNVGDEFCMGYSGTYTSGGKTYPSSIATLYTPVAGAAAGSNNYLQSYAASCKAADIASAKAVAATSSIQLTLKATGNATVPNVLFFNSQYDPVNMKNGAGNIIAWVNGKLLLGRFDPKGPSPAALNVGFGLNKVAADAEVVAAGLKALP